MPSRPRVFLLTTSLLALVATRSEVAWAVDGVLEINQDCAATDTNAGCFTGDSPGFPITIASSGSYRLTGNLVVASGTASAVEVAADDVTIDLNGFTLDGTGSSGSGIVVIGAKRNLEVRAGTIRSFGGDGIKAAGADSHAHRVIAVRVLSNQGDGIDFEWSTSGRNHTIEGCTVNENGGAGIRAGSTSRVERNTVRGSGGNGIEVGEDSVISGNTVDGSTLDGIQAHRDSLIAGNTVSQNLQDGISTAENSSVIDNTISGNNLYGLRCGPNTGFRGNVFANNNGSGDEHDCAAAVNMGANLCDGAACL